jgi:hypothetical protein
MSYISTNKIKKRDNSKSIIETIENTSREWRFMKEELKCLKNNLRNILTFYRRKRDS